MPILKWPRATAWKRTVERNPQGHPPAPLDYDHDKEIGRQQAKARRKVEERRDLREDDLGWSL